MVLRGLHDGDGTTDRSEFYTHNADSIRTRVDFDDDADGMIDRITHYAFDGDGNRRVTRRDADLDDDGTIDRTVHLNAEGRWERVERDDDDDGNIDRTTETGAPPTSRVALSSLDGTNGFTLTGIDAYDRSGHSVSSAGDVNGDGYDDLIIAARVADPNGNSAAGETYLVYGGASAPGTNGVLDLGALDGTNGFILTGIDGYDESGFSVSSAGDVNGDGYDDLIIGAHRADPNASLSGETYILYGGATGTESLTPVTASGTAAADNFTGNAGDDSFTAIATNDVVRGGAGNAEVRVEDGVTVTLAATGSQSARSKIDPKTDTGIDPVAETRTDPGLDDALMNNDLWDDLWGDGVRSLDQSVHIDEDAILTPLSDPLSFGPLSSGLLPGPWGDLMYWLGSHPAMQNNLAMILPEMEIVTADMEGF